MEHGEIGYKVVNSIELAQSVGRLLPLVEAVG
jgi:hypothetical protein